MGITMAAHPRPPNDTWGQLPGFTSLAQGLSSPTKNVGASGQDGHWGPSQATWAGHGLCCTEKGWVARTGPGHTGAAVLPGR